MDRDMMLQSPELDQLATALAAAQGELKDADKNSINPHLKSKYADLAEILQTVRPVLSAHGLAVIQGVGYAAALASVKTRLLHKSGQYIEDILHIPVTKQDAQGLGAAITYGRRYSLAAILGISQDDDDGESAKAPQKRSRDPGSSNKTQEPITGPGSMVEMMTKAFSEITAGGEARMKQLTEEFLSLSPAEQEKVLPAAKAARTRLAASTPPPVK